MTPDEARKRLHDASDDLEALRTQVLCAEPSDRPEDQPIEDAWRVALSRFRDACTNYAETLSGYIHD
jgi:hypothetical protein